MKYTTTHTTLTTKTTIEIRLSDDYGNGNADFSITGGIHKKDRLGRWIESAFGCIHDEILKIWPEFKPFVDLHLSDSDGAPMHAMENAFYWFAGIFPDNLGQRYTGATGSGKPSSECERIFCEHLRITTEEANAIIAIQPHDCAFLQYLIEGLGLPAKWKRDAQAAIAQLEALTGESFEYTPTRPHFAPLTAEQRNCITEKIMAGFYAPEQVEARAAAERINRTEAMREKILTKHAGKLAELEHDKNFNLEFLRLGYDPDDVNLIYYKHTNTLTANWTSSRKLLTRDEFDSITSTLEMSILPPGLIFSFQDKPKH